VSGPGPDSPPVTDRYQGARLIHAGLPDGNPGRLQESGTFRADPDESELPPPREASGPLLASP